MTSKYYSQIPFFEELRGERVAVRPYRLEDAEALREAVVESRDHIRPWLPFANEHQSIEETRDVITKMMARWMLREDMTLGIFDRETGAFLGGTGVHIRNWDIGYFEIGYWLRASAEGKGYVRESVRLLTDYLAREQGANRIEIRCDARNTRSAAVAEALGFVREGTLRNHARATDGALRDTLYFSLTPGDTAWPVMEA